MVGFSLCMPSLSKAFRKAKGKIFPFGWYYIWKAIRKNDEVDMYFTGVLLNIQKKDFIYFIIINFILLLMKKVIFLLMQPNNWNTMLLTIFGKNMILK
jgi:hypothetical protein